LVSLRRVGSRVFSVDGGYYDVGGCLQRFLEVTPQCRGEEMFFNPIVVISKLSACVEGIFVAEEEVGEFIEDEVGVMGAGLWGWVSTHQDFVEPSAG
jgi:hypothetical protein